jgi:L-threonylcarbamoyladenylate synthase
VETIIGTDIAAACTLLKSGGLVAIPTETVYGLAADATNEPALAEIFIAKGRPTSNPLILHFPSLEAALPYCLEIPTTLSALAQRFWPGPLTLIVQKSSLVSALVTAGQDSVAIRVPKHPLTRALLAHMAVPLAAPSANKYGELSPTSAPQVASQLSGRIPYILDGGSCDGGLESTIVGMVNERVVVYRLGGLSLEDLENELGYLPEVRKELHAGVRTSGMVKHHYATQTPLYFYDGQDLGPTDCLIYHSENLHSLHANNSCLSQHHNLIEAAQNLYACLHELDQLKYKRLFIERFPDLGLGRTMNDRLERATAKFQD